jgi:uncharacterized membrane protein
MNKLKDTDIQATIGWVLRTGVMLSISIVLFGGAVYIYRHGHDIANYSTFKDDSDFAQLTGIINGILTFRGRAIIQGGIILLIATPIISLCLRRIICILVLVYWFYL